MRIALVSMPWLSPYRPSIQLGALQAYLARHRPEVEVDALHLHLEAARHLDYALLQRVADGQPSSWLGEALSAYLLFPERRPVLDRFLDYLVAGDPLAEQLGEGLLLPYSRFVQASVAQRDWSQYDLVGISVSLCQTLSSVLLARRLKAAHPGLRVVLGGPILIGRVGESFLQAFPQDLDAVVQGEGESPLLHIVDALAAGRSLAGLPGVVTAEGAGTPQRLELAQLDELPCPEYRPYFATLESLACREQVRGALEVPVEGSRGCWWDRRPCVPDGACGFCNLNLQWMRYREKPVVAQLAELRELLERHAAAGLRRFLFVDSGFRRRRADVEAVFRAIRDELPQPIQIYMEARANLPPQLWALLAEAGVSHCQVGIEGLVDSVLRKINKGATALMNFDAMKQMERHGIEDPANLIYDLPDLTVAEVEQTIARVELARAYGPILPVRLFLNYGSPYYDRFFGPGALDPPPNRNYRAWQILLPPEIEQRLFLTQREWEPQVPGMAEAVERLQAACADWQEHYERRKAEGLRWLLTLRPDPGQPEAWVVDDHRWPEAVQHRLDATEARVARACDSRRRRSRVYEALAPLSPTAVDQAIASLERRGLALVVDDELLSLPICAEEPAAAEPAES